jgi:AcrR family transcriptional regulator
MTRSVNKQGQSLGRKGTESRRRLMDSTLSLLSEHSAHKLSASRIARVAGMASQSFYLYFKDIDELLLALAEEAAADIGSVVDALREAPGSSEPGDVSRRVIDAYSAYWDKHRSILSARNYIADSGNMAFLKLRQESTMPVILAVAERIVAADSGGLRMKEAVARAVVVYQAMERLAARSNAVEYRSAEQPQELQIEKTDLRQAEIDILTLLFTPVQR